MHLVRKASVTSDFARLVHVYAIPGRTNASWQRETSISHVTHGRIIPIRAQRRNVEEASVSVRTVSSDASFPVTLVNHVSGTIRRGKPSVTSVNALGDSAHV